MNNEKLIDKSHVVVHAENLKKHYPTKGGKILKALDGVSFDIYEGEILGVVGESGCGKSTLGRSVLRLFPVTEGKLEFEGHDITNLSKRQLKNYRRDMQMIFQNPYSSFNPKQKIGSALREVGKVYKMSDEEINQKIKELLEYIRLP